VISLREAIEEFQHAEGGDRYWEEYGIDDEDCALRLRAMFATCGVDYIEDAVFLHGKLATHEQIMEEKARDAAVAARRQKWRDEHPELIAKYERGAYSPIDAMTRNMLEEAVTDSIFNSSKLWTVLK
jgi:hypothetical protein